MNLKIKVTGTYEDKYGEAHWNEEVAGDLQNFESVVNQAIEALGRMEKHIGVFVNTPLPNDVDEEEKAGSEHEEFLTATLWK